MNLSLLLLHLMGAIMLLLYAVHLVRTSMERAHDAALQRMRELERRSQNLHLQRRRSRSPLPLDV